MQMQISSTERIPKEGTIDNFIDRLSRYMTFTDKEWVKRIKPAKLEEVEQLKELSGMNKMGMNLPKIYEIYLAYMGRDDGGIVGELLHGIASIEDLLELYEEIRRDEPQISSVEKLIFFDSEVNVSYEIEVAQDNPTVYEAGIIYSETFEKFIFQCTYIRNESVWYNKHKGFSISGFEFNAKDNTGNFFEEIDKCLGEQGFKKIWFSDQKMYCGMHPEATFWAKKWYGGAVSGAFHSNNERLLEDICNKFTKEIKIETN